MNPFSASPLSTECQLSPHISTSLNSADSHSHRPSPFTSFSFTPFSCFSRSFLVPWIRASISPFLRQILHPGFFQASLSVLLSRICGTTFQGAEWKTRVSFRDQVYKAVNAHTSYITIFCPQNFTAPSCRKLNRTGDLVSSADNLWEGGGKKAKCEGN